MKIGVAGVLYGSTVHIPGLQAEGVDVLAVCARRAERARETADRFGIPHTFTSYEEMLAMDELDAVAIVTPVHLHAEMALLALDAGKHILCEKPFTVTADEALGVLERSEQTSLTAMVGLEFRFASARMAAKELIEQGFLGELGLVSCRLALHQPKGRDEPRPFDEDRDVVSRGGGMLLSQGSHYIDGLRYLFGEISEVSGELFNLAPERVRDGAIVHAEAEDSFAASLTFASGGRAEVLITRSVAYGEDSMIEMYGSQGTLVTPQTGINPPAHGVLLGARRGEDGLSRLAIPERLEPFSDDRDDRLMPFRLLVREFVRGIEQGCSPTPNFYDGYRCQLVLDALRRSAQEKRRVAVPAR